MSIFFHLTERFNQLINSPMKIEIFYGELPISPNLPQQGNKVIEAQSFEKENPNLEEIETMGRDGESITILKNPLDGHYYAKGSFGNEKKIYYLALGDDLSTESKQSLLGQWRRRNTGDKI